MLALSPLALSYAPAFVARPVAVRSSVHMNHGMPPVYYDHDQEVLMRPLLLLHPHTQSNSNCRSPTMTGLQEPEGRVHDELGLLVWAGSTASAHAAASCRPGCRTSR